MATSSRKAPRSAGVSTTSLLTLAERRILDNSVGRALADATHKQLQTTLAKARVLRDKWQDLFKRQSVAAKRTTARGEPVNTRTLDKSELFAAAVKRIEARIAQATEAVAAAVTAMEATAAGRPAKKAAPGKTAVKKKAVKKSVAKKAAATKAAARAAASAATKPTVSKKARQAGARKTLTASATGQAIGFDPKKQRSAKASATRAQLKLDGLSTRRRGHDITTGKQKQARRDGR